MIIPFSLRRPGPAAIAGTHSAGAAPRLPGSRQRLVHARRRHLRSQSRRCASGDRDSEALAWRGRRRAPGHRDPHFGFTARGVGGAWI
ncbi:hypothetical protein VULLAG_LOCUS22154 [Vulpes lagopus]